MPWWALGKWVNIVEKYIPVKPEGLFYNPLFVLVYGGYVTPQEAYWTARNSLNIEIYQEIACQDPVYAYWFARYVPGANIKYCQSMLAMPIGVFFLRQTFLKQILNTTTLIWLRMIREVLRDLS